VSDTPKTGALRVWHIPQIPGKPFRVGVATLREGALLLRVLADYDLFQIQRPANRARVNMVSPIDPGSEREGSGDASRRALQPCGDSRSSTTLENVMPLPATLETVSQTDTMSQTKPAREPYGMNTAKEELIESAYVAAARKLPDIVRAALVTQMAKRMPRRKDRVAIAEYNQIREPNVFIAPEGFSLSYQHESTAADED
jgi:hypothetical protein